jgi:hypothetical protein
MFAECAGSYTKLGEGTAENRMEVQLCSWEQSFRNYKAFRNDKEDAMMASLFSSVKLIKLLVKQKMLLLVNMMIKVATERHFQMSFVF